jgi:hypothetical protein
MDIAMAGTAIPVRNRPVHRDRFPSGISFGGQVCCGVALVAPDGLVLAAERILGGVVIEPGSGAPFPGVVATGAGLVEGASVRVLVATGAVALETGPGRFATGRQRRGTRATQLGIVTLLAAELRMAFFERPTRSAVVEPLGTAIGPLDQLKVDSGMLWVAAGAGCGTSGGDAVKATTPGREPLDVTMAREAPGLEPVLPTTMALSALEATLELLMRSRQLAGRDLRRSPGD